METGSIIVIVIDRILGLLTDETISFRGLLDPGVIESLKLQLKMIQSLLKDMDELGHKLKKKWVEELAYLVQRLESIFYTYLLRIAQRGQPDFIIKLISGRSASSEIQLIIKELQQIKQWGDTGESIWSPRRTDDYQFVGDISFLPGESEVVGLDYEKEQLLSALIGESSEGLVISLVGIGELVRLLLLLLSMKTK